MMNGDTLKWVGGVLAGAGWFTLVVLGMADADTFVQFAQYVLVGLGAHGMTLSRAGGTMTPPKPAVAPPVAPVAVPAAQSGRVEMWLLVAVAIVLGVLLSACAAIPTPLVGAVKASDDNAIENWKLVACGMPLSAILRHPEVIPSLRSLCLPAQGTSDPNALLPGGAK